MINLRPTKDQILQKIREIKYTRFGEVSIEGNINGSKYQLLLLTDECTKNNNIIKLLADWRKKHERWFPTQFKVTEKGTKEWLKLNVIDTVDRLLFMIQVNNQYIGHIGLFRFSFQKFTCEIDNIIRGEALYPGIMTNAIMYMMDWGKSELGLTGYTLETTSDNERALKLYKRLGFVEDKRIPAIHVRKNNRMEWIPAPKNYKKKIIRYFVYMKQPNL